MSIFEPFGKISQFKKLTMAITQKLHGTNAQIFIFQDDETDEVKLRCGSRNRWIFPGDDNFGFASFVHEHKGEFISKLGLGRHYGEWCGPGINSGEGLTDKTFFLFNHRRWEGEELPPRTRTVPVLYSGPLDLSLVDKAMRELKEFGSAAVPGFMRPEGVVIEIGGKFFKHPFEAEETKWTKTSKAKAPKAPRIDYSDLCQPVRLEKLLSRDERYGEGYPGTLSLIVKDYIEDLLSEDQIPGDEDQKKATQKDAARQLYRFVKDYFDEKSL